MQAIITRRLPATNTKPFRIKASCARGSIIICEDASTEETTIRRAMAKSLPTGEGELEKLVAQFKITRSELAEAMSFAEREEGKISTLWDLVQGFTAYARGFDYIDARVDMEKRGSALLKLVAE